MLPEEARIIRDVFDRLRSMGPVRDAEARAAVEAELRANPDAAIGLVQAVVALERDRQALEQRIAELERGGAAPASGGLFDAAPGPWGRGQPRGPQPQPDPYSAPRGGWQQAPAAPVPPPAPQPAPQQSGGGLFSTILGAATGLAAGYVGYEAMKGLFGGGHGNGGHDGGGLFGSSDHGNSPSLPEWGARDSSDDQAFFGGDDSGGDGGDFA